MDYKTIELPNYGIEIEVGVIPKGSTSKFLSELNLDGKISKYNWESVLLERLLKDHEELIDFLEQLPSEKEKTIFRYQLMDAIYKTNNKLRPHNVVIYPKGLIYVSDALRQQIPTDRVLPSNPEWFDASEKRALDTDGVNALIDKVWLYIKKKFGTDRDYIKQKVKVIDVDIPILDISSAGITLDDIIKGFLERVNGDVHVAKNSYRLWVGHILAATVPDVEKIIYALAEGLYMDTYTDNVIMFQLYASVVQVNPELDWDRLDWTPYLREGEENDTTTRVPKRRLPTSRKPVGRVGLRKSSKEEVEQERKHFNDVSYTDLFGLRDKLKSRVLGQDEALDALADALCIARVGLRGEDSPIGCFLLPGPTGTGKTETAKVLAEELGVELIRVDCSEYQHAHEISKIFGSPPGYVGHEDSRGAGSEYVPPTTVASKLREHPYCVLLFDEVEKAHEALFNTLLQIMDEARITSGRGDTIRFKEAIILLTSNVGTKEAEEACNKNRLGFGENDLDKCLLSNDAIQAAINEKFKPEFRNRLTETIIYNRLGKDVCKGIVDLMLDKTKVLLEKAQQVTMVWNDRVRNYLVDLGYSDEYGARELKRIVKRNVELPLAKFIMEEAIVNNNGLPSGSLIRLNVKKNEIIFSREDNNGKKTSSSANGLPSSGITKPDGRQLGNNKTSKN